MSPYWPWWAGAVGLALVIVNHTLTTDRSFGVSSAWDRVLHWRRERRLERAEEEFTDEQALVDALAAATAEHFGTAAPNTHAAHGTSYGDPQAYYGAPQAPYATPQTYCDTPQTPYAAPQPTAPVVEPVAEERSSAMNRRPAPLVTQASLLVSIFLGGLIASLVSGRFEIRFDMGPGFRDLVTGNPLTMVVLLFLGGVLVGFGTRLAGGCSSGHGLSGCGRLQPVSIVATAVFFGTAAGVSFLLWKVI
ncbi:YeeE/YedE family protein [Streptomyces sp. RY43-2]|uniref:YeeE/YedE family protein n=1 Tax=Streptomyces macrolidinus TaxID=2952607 RepID=A0ABT0ZKZ4_9ACTN|nr:YeeE/YedE thiosulfate transporter family protein [Streptomyces macrolidinus]MCN9244250.1 YeeE/YedE family protein [Streptomyces macrolidinus]